jgi:hypothetical protein
MSGVVAGGLGGLASYGGAAAGGTIAAWIGTASLALVAGPATLGALIGGVIGVAGYRKAYRWARRGGDKALERLIKAVAAEAGKRPSD